MIKKTGLILLLLGILVLAALPVSANFGDSTETTATVAPETTSHEVSVPETNQAPVIIVKPDRPLQNNGALPADQTQKEINSFTGDPMEEERGESESEKVKPAEIEEGMYFDPEKAVFLYEFGTEGTLTSNVADGMVLVSHKVVLEKKRTDFLSVYRNGEKQEFETVFETDEAGSYVVVYEANGKRDKVMSFILIRPVTNELTRYDMPQYFRIRSVYLDNELISSDPYYVIFEEDGVYNVTYECPKINMSCGLTFTLDRTPSELKLEAVNENGYAEGPVDISDRNPEDEIQILFEGQEYNLPKDNVLRSHGNYGITLRDPAGNATQYAFVIKPYLNISIGVIIGIAVILAVGLIVFLVRTRFYTRVR